MGGLENAHGLKLIAEVIAVFVIVYGGIFLVVLYVLGPMWRKRD